MATKCPHAHWDPLGPQTEPRLLKKDVICLHTMAGSFAGVDAMFHASGYSGVESHFGVAGSGMADQWQDLDYQADANLDGNHRCISIETADMGEGFPAWSGSDVPRWTKAQANKIVEIVTWLCRTYKIPPQLIPDTKPGRRGIAYHRQGIDGNYTTYKGRVPGGEKWSESTGKACPGDRRIKQLIEEVIPAVQAKLKPEPVDFDYRVNATKNDRKQVRRFERADHRLARYLKRKVRKGWRVVVRKVKSR